MTNPLDKKVNLSLGELIKIGFLIGAIYVGGFKGYILLKETNSLLKTVQGELKYIHTIFKEAEGK